MNERIKEFLTPKLKEWGGASGDNFSEELEKFAELIVLECADYVQFYYKDHMCEVIAHDMKQHFGVEQAWEEASKEVSEEDYHTHVHEGIFQTKFAELIVKECVSVVQRQYNGDLESGYYRGLFSATEIIKEHFGVEE